MKSNCHKSFGRRLLSILLSGAMLCGVLTPVSVFAEPEQVQGEAAVTDAEEVLMDAAEEAVSAQLNATSITPKPIEDAEAYPATVGAYQRRNGYFTYQVEVGEAKREAEVYIPGYARQREYWIVIALPNGVDSVDFMNKSGWFTVADNSLTCLLILKPLKDKGAWGSFDEEMPYVNACMDTLASNGKYYSAFTYDYLVGYGEGCPFLQLWAEQNPLKMISQAYIGAVNDNGVLNKIKEASEKQIGETPQPNHMDFEGFNLRGTYTKCTDKDGNPVTQKRTFEALRNKDIAIPTLLLSNTDETDSDIATFWLDVNRCDYEPDIMNTPLGNIYTEGETSECVTTSYSGVSSAVAIGEGDISYTDTAVTARVYSFVTTYSGYDNNSAYGHFITYRLDYAEAIEDGNLIYKNHEWDGTNRVYEIYIPKSVKETPTPAPVVFANHGAGQTAFVFMEATDIKTAAEKYGFVAVTFDLTGNADYMVDLVELVKADCLKAGVTLDESRFYAYGQSAGGGAVANTLAQNEKTVNLFAAFGYTSGTRAAAQSGGVDSVIPVYAIYGEYDYWPNKLGPLAAGEWCGSQGAAQAVWTTDTQTYWANRLLGLTLDELINPDNYTVEDGIGSVYKEQRTPLSVIVSPTDDVNRYRSYIWSTDTGEGKAPIFVWSQCFGRGHNLVPSDLDQLWENWFSKWQLMGNSSLYFENGVGRGSSVAVKRKAAGISVEAKDLDAIETADVDLGKSALIPLSGYYTKTVDVNGTARPVKLFMSDYTACRAYATVIAVPDGVDTYEFLQRQGWLELANSRGEFLVVLEPGEKGWGEAEDEKAYVEAAMTFANTGRNAKNVTLFTNHSTYYFVGYGKGAAALETWSAKNPTYVDSQALLHGKSVGKTFLDEEGAKIYDGTNTGGYDPGILDLNEFKAVLKDLGYSNVISRKDVPVPTWFDGYAADDYSIAYWKAANDVSGDADNEGVFRQSINSDAFQTEYENSWRARHGLTTGIAKVKVTDYNGYPSAQELGAFLYRYSRYNTPFAYSNHLSERQDYTPARVAAQKAAAGKAIDETTFVAYDEPYKADSDKVYQGYNLLARERSNTANGVYESGIFATADDNDDGKLDAREYLMYIPKSAKGSTPVVVQFPGMTQSVAVGFDSTQWWRIADEYGVVIIILGEVYNNGVALSWKNSDTEYMAVMDILADEIDGKDVEIDWTRIYGSGHSLGSAQVQTFAHTHPEFFAAVASTSFGSQSNKGKYEAIPAYLAVGQSDLPFLMKDLWTSASLKSWFSYLAAVDDLKVTEATPENADFSSTEGRYKDYVWNNRQGIPMVKWTQTYLREHNCYPAEVQFAWDFLNKYSKDEDGRYYSASAFATDDKVKIERQYEGTDFDSYKEALETDFTQAAQLPLTGYFYKLLDNNRIAHLYISSNASIRTYFTVVAVPEGVDTRTFLDGEGWIELAEEKGEALLILEPGYTGWGSAEDEYEYIDGAIGFVKSGVNANRVSVFSNFGEFYLAGYGKGAAPLELWAARNPIFVIAQSYFGGEPLGAEAYSEAGAIEYDRAGLEQYLEEVGFTGNLKNSQIPVPTWLCNAPEGSASIAYWKAVNEASGEADADGIFYQDIKSKAFATEYANKLLAEAGAKHGFSEVKVTASETTPSAADIYKWMSTFSRYDNTLAYSNALSYRMDYTAATVNVQKQAKAEGARELTYTKADGETGKVALWGNADTHVTSKDDMYKGTVNVGIMAFADNSGDGVNDPREYILYVPDSVKDSGKTVPVVMVYAGNSQTDRIFYDCTLWYQLADMNGFVCMFPCETYNKGGVTVSHYNNDLFFYSMRQALTEVLAPQYGFTADMTRVYATGQSAGSSATQGFARTIPQCFAAVASTSAANSAEGTGEMIPDYLISGIKDMGNMGLGIPGSSTLVAWAEYLLKANSVTNPNVSTPDYATTKGRYHTQAWSNDQGIELVKYSLNVFRPHNCYPEDMALLWDFMKNFSVTVGEDGKAVRYYSASGFKNDDAIVITSGKTPVNPDIIREFVTKLYSEFLNRDPDETGISEWVNALKNGTTDLAHVIKGFVLSPEFKDRPLNNNEYVKALYNIIFRREADESGLKSWVEVLENGATRKKVLAGFVNSDEMKNLAASLGVAAGSYKSNDILDENYGVTSFVARLYRVCLDRRFDENGLTAWVTVLLNGSATGSKVARNFLLSPEMDEQGHDNESFLKVCYRALFDREPDTSGFSEWFVAMDKYPREKIIKGFTDSPEFAALCERYGITQK
jgi:poly(3-hydroxybutyrate) depolymerase